MQLNNWGCINYFIILSVQSKGPLLLRDKRVLLFIYFLNQIKKIKAIRIQLILQSQWMCVIYIKSHKEILKLKRNSSSGIRRISPRVDFLYIFDSVKSNIVIILIYFGETRFFFQSESSSFDFFDLAQEKHPVSWKLYLYLHHKYVAFRQHNYIVVLYRNVQKLTSHQNFSTISFQTFGFGG